MRVRKRKKTGVIEEVNVDFIAYEEGKRNNMGWKIELSDMIALSRSRKKVL